MCFNPIDNSRRIFQIPEVVESRFSSHLRQKHVQSPLLAEFRLNVQVTFMLPAVDKGDDMICSTKCLQNIDLLELLLSVFWP